MQETFPLHERWTFPKELEDQYNPIIDHASGIRKYFTSTITMQDGSQVVEVLGSNEGVVEYGKKVQENKKKSYQHAMSIIDAHVRNANTGAFSHNPGFSSQSGVGHTNPSYISPGNFSSTGINRNGPDGLRDELNRLAIDVYREMIRAGKNADIGEIYDRVYELYNPYESFDDPAVTDYFWRKCNGSL